MAAAKVRNQWLSNDKVKPKPGDTEKLDLDAFAADLVDEVALRDPRRVASLLGTARVQEDKAARSAHAASQRRWKDWL